MVGFYLHPAASSVASLPSFKVSVDIVCRKVKARRNALNDAGQRLPVRFPGCHETKR